MRTSTFIAVSLFSLTSTVIAAPTPQLNNILGSITNPGAGNNNVFEGNGANSGNNNGQGNSAGNNDGNNNVVGSGSSAGVGNTLNLGGILKARQLPGLTNALSELELENTIGSVTNPTAGSGNSFLGNGANSGNNNGQGNSAGDNSGNGNTIGSGNTAGSGNSINVSPDVALPSISLPDINL